MQNTDKQKLKKQIEQEARQIINLDGNDLAISLLSTCNALLKMAERSLPKDNNVRITNEVYANYLSFAVRVSRFYELHAGTGEGNDAEISEKLKQILEEVQSKKDRATSLQSEYESALSANEEFQFQINDLQIKLKEQITVKDGLDKMYEECRPEIIDTQKRKNEELFIALTKKKDELKRLESRFKELVDEKKDVTDSINSTEKAIDAIPEEIIMLRTKYKELENLLIDLQKAEKEYSPEKQMELQKKINELMPIVDENRVATEVLSNRLESLNQQNTEYDKERHTLTTNVVDLIATSMEDLKKYLKEYEEFLDTTEKTADTLASNLLRCQERYEEYSNWYDASKTPLEAMIASLERLEYSDLRKSLDIGQVPDIKKKFETIRQNLQNIDYILAACARAVQKDLQRIKRRAGQ